MRPISDYLKKLLYQYDCLVVPALGAFLMHGVSATYNETTGQFLPPRRKVAFNEALRLDDGILLNYVVLHENCSRDEALQAIQQFVTDLKTQVREQGSFVVDGLGMFTSNSENNLQFDPELRHNFLGNAFGLQPLLLTRQMVHPAVPVSVKPTVVKPMPVTALVVIGEPATTGVGEVMAMPVVAPRTQPVWRWAAVAAVVGPLGVMGYFSVIQPNQSLQSSLNPGHLFSWSAALSSKTEPAAPALSTRTEETPPVAEPVAAAPVTVAPTVVKPEVVASSPAVKPASVAARTDLKTKKATAIEAASALPNVPYTVIAGSFANRGNAIRFQKRLKRAGYADAYILPGRTKGLIKVAAVGADDYEVAKASLGSLTDLTGITPWIMRHR